MKTTGKPVFYWDSCVILAWIQDEVRPNPAEMEGVGRVADALERGEVMLTTSVLSHIEALPSSMADEKRKQYDGVFDRPDYFDQQGITGPIIALARQIRDATKVAGGTISTPDAIHVATAMVVKVAAFHTFDGAGKKSKKGKLIPLSGTATVEGLMICPPDYKTPPQPAPQTPKTSDLTLFEEPPADS